MSSSPIAAVLVRSESRKTSEQARPAEFSRIPLRSMVPHCEERGNKGGNKFTTYPYGLHLVGQSDHNDGRIANSLVARAIKACFFNE